jgi:uncharacterized membrane protein
MNHINTPNFAKTSVAQNISRYILALFLSTAGISHLTWNRTEFLAQVPPWIPVNADLVVLMSGVVEIALGLSLILLFKYRILVGWIVASFFVLVFPGNIAQLVEHKNAFGLNTELARWLRLPLQPLLILVALWSTGAWHSWRKK